jgi:hypothetical protein
MKIPTNKDTLQGYACLAVACTLGLVILTIMTASIVHWVTT